MQPTPHQSANNQFQLLRQRRFAPFFWTQFLGASNDNLFKFAFTILVTYHLQISWLPPAQAGLVIGAVFISPFLFFSATSGQFADKLQKHQLIRIVKTAEVGLMMLGCYGFAVESIVILLLVLFGMGVHSAVFGPVKFAYLPSHLKSHELLGGNGMVEMGTFVAILLGNMTAGLLMSLPHWGTQGVGVVCTLFALLGCYNAWRIPVTPANDPHLKINWNIGQESWRNLQFARQDPIVFQSLLHISWMWFFGAVFLSQFPYFAKAVLHGDEQVASLLLLLFSVGIGAGSLLCESFSRGRFSAYIVHFGALGMSVFTLDLYFATNALTEQNTLGLWTFLAQPEHWRVLLDICLMSLSIGLYIVPLYTLVQQRASVTHLARIIATNNILNSLYMVASALIVTAVMTWGANIPQIFLLLATANTVLLVHRLIKQKVRASAHSPANQTHLPD